MQLKSLLSISGIVASIESILNQIGCYTMKWNLTNLQALTPGTEVVQLLSEGCENRVDGGKDGRALSGGQQELGDDGNDANGWLGTNWWQGLIEWSHAEAIDQLGGLHGITRGHIESRHIPLDVVVADHGDEPGHLDEEEETLLKLLWTILTEVVLSSIPEMIHVGGMKTNNDLYLNVMGRGGVGWVWTTANNYSLYFSLQRLMQPGS